MTESDNNILLPPLKQNKVIVDGYTPFVPQPIASRPVLVLPWHGRSFPESSSLHKAVWSDEFGNLFGSRSVKGHPSQLPYLVYSPDFPPYYICTMGLLTRSMVEVAQRASDYMRAHGLPTERVIAINELLEIPTSRGPISVEEWKRRQNAIKKPLDDLDGKARVSPRQKKAYLRQTEYVIIEREMPVAYRLQDIFYEESDSVITQRLQEVLNWLNVAMPIEIGRRLINGERLDQWRKLSPDSKDDIAYYLIDFLPKRMGEYLSKMHGLNICHGFPTSHNWTMSGCLVDLDSVHGRPLGDPPVVKQEIIEDILKSMRSLDYYSFRVMSRLCEFENKDRIEAIANFASSYCRYCVQQLGVKPVKALELIVAALKKVTISEVDITTISFKIVNSGALERPQNSSLIQRLIEKLKPKQ